MAKIFCTWDPAISVIMTNLRFLCLLMFQEEALHGGFRVHTAHDASWGREVLPDKPRRVWTAKPLEGKFSAAGMEPPLCLLTDFVKLINKILHVCFFFLEPTLSFFSALYLTNENCFYFAFGPSDTLARTHWQSDTPLMGHCSALDKSPWLRWQQCSSISFTLEVAHEAFQSSDPKWRRCTKHLVQLSSFTCFPWFPSVVSCWIVHVVVTALHLNWLMRWNDRMYNF